VKAAIIAEPPMIIRRSSLMGARQRAEEISLARLSVKMGTPEKLAKVQDTIIAKDIIK
jgi:hypothetical protein